MLLCLYSPGGPNRNHPENVKWNKTPKLSLCYASWERNRSVFERILRKMKFEHAFHPTARDSWAYCSQVNRHISRIVLLILTDATRVGFENEDICASLRCESDVWNEFSCGAHRSSRGDASNDTLNEIGPQLAEMQPREGEGAWFSTISSWKSRKSSNRLFYAEIVENRVQSATVCIIVRARDLHTVAFSMQNNPIFAKAIVRRRYVSVYLLSEIH